MAGSAKITDLKLDETPPGKIIVKDKTVLYLPSYYYKKMPDGTLKKTYFNQPK